ncbi:hypothetical protein [Agarilytica rhodophyticola]|uniref:hypothetical protein n=1 Tax=Agarilytica rhodophyticola TaxID=1737490 RepID=UPI000B346CAE|nr:hypothetical protein [Agarilytica rhodophyticola]
MPIVTIKIRSDAKLTKKQMYELKSLIESVSHDFTVIGAKYDEDDYIEQDGTVSQIFSSPESLLRMDGGLSLRFRRARKTKVHMSKSIDSITPEDSAYHAAAKKITKGEYVNFYELMIAAKFLDVSPAWLIYGYGNVGDRYDDSEGYLLSKLMIECRELSCGDMELVVSVAQDLKQHRLASS